MKAKQLADRIGNIDDQFIQQAQYTPNYSKVRRTKRIQKFFTAAIAIVLMAASFTAGALACSTETIIEVPIEQEHLALSDLGLTFLLPDNWKGQYALETTDMPDNYRIYCPEVRKAMEQWSGIPNEGGVLFYIVRINEVLTPEQAENGEWSFAANRYLFATKDCTYLLYFASDVQYTPETEAIYRELAQQIKDIRIIVDTPLAE